MTEVTVVNPPSPEVVTKTPPPDAAVEIARIEAEADMHRSDNNAAVELAAIDARQDEELQLWRQRAETAEAQRDALTLEVSNLKSQNLDLQATASNLATAAETVAEAAAETTNSTPPSTPDPISETLTEAIAESAEPVEVETPAAAEPEAPAVAVEAVVKKGRRIIL